MPARRRPIAKDFTHRELDIMFLILQDFSDQQITRHFSWSKHDFETHSKKLLKKAGVETKDELIDLIFRQVVEKKK